MKENEKVRPITEDLFPNFNNEIYLIENYGVNVDVIDKIRAKQKYKKEHMKELYNRYRVCEESVPIFNRTFTEEGAINNKLNNDYFGEIVRTTVGYFAGSPFSYTYSQVDKDNNGNGEINVKDEVLERNIDIVKHFVLYNGLADKDVEATKVSSICGYIGRLMYIDKEGEEAVAMLDPWEVTVLSRHGIERPEYALREMEGIEVVRDGEKATVTKLEFYDSKFIYYFEDGKDGMIPDYSMLNAEKGIHMATVNGIEYVIQEHLFDYCPLQAIPQNKEALGIAENVLSLIDAIDRTTSDCNSEVEAFKLAYLLIKGAEIDDDELEKARVTGTFVLPALADNVGMEYLTKQINDVFVENHLNRLDKNIYRFSSTPDLSDDAFGQTSSGIAMKFKLFPLETRCIMFERKYHEANMYMFKVLASSLKKKNIDFDPLEVVIEYKRSIPIDLSYEADCQAKLKGLVSEQTRLNLASFCEDSEYEIELMKKEQEDIEPLDFENEPKEDGAGDMPKTSIV